MKHAWLLSEFNQLSEFIRLFLWNGWFYKNVEIDEWGYQEYNWLSYAGLVKSV